MASQSCGESPTPAPPAPTPAPPAPTPAPMCSTVPYLISLEGVPRVAAKAGILRKDATTLHRSFPKIVTVPGVATGVMMESDLKAGERGCSIAHRELWSSLQHKKGPHLILEDDAHPRSEADLCSRLQGLEKSMQDQQLDMINLGPCFWDGSRKNGSPCAHAYMLSQNGAQLAHAHTDSLHKPIDQQLRDLCTSRKLSCDVVDLFEQQNEGFSYIHSPHVSSVFLS